MYTQSNRQILVTIVAITPTRIVIGIALAIVLLGISGPIPGVGTMVVAISVSLAIAVIIIVGAVFLIVAVGRLRIVVCLSGNVQALTTINVVRVSQSIRLRNLVRINAIIPANARQGFAIANCVIPPSAIGRWSCLAG